MTEGTSSVKDVLLNRVATRYSLGFPHYCGRRDIARYFDRAVASWTSDDLTTLLVHHENSNAGARTGNGRMQSATTSQAMALEIIYRSPFQLST